MLMPPSLPPQGRDGAQGQTLRAFTVKQLHDVRAGREGRGARKGGAAAAG